MTLWLSPVSNFHSSRIRLTGNFHCIEKVIGIERESETAIENSSSVHSNLKQFCGILREFDCWMGTEMVHLIWNCSKALFHYRMPLWLLHVVRPYVTVNYLELIDEQNCVLLWTMSMLWFEFALLLPSLNIWYSSMCCM